MPLAIAGAFAAGSAQTSAVVLLNAAAALLIAGRAQSLPEGVALARASIDGGAAGRAVERLAAVTRA